MKRFVLNWLVPKAFITAAKDANSVQCLQVFVKKDSFFTLCHSIEIHSFPMSAIKHFCYKPLPKFLDPNSVVIYSSRPVK
jgi:hypothetical protein